MAVNRRPLYQSHETIRLEPVKRRRTPAIVGAVAAITLAGALLGNGLTPAPAAQTQPRPTVVSTGSTRGALAEALPTVAPGGPSAQPAAPVAPAPVAAAPVAAAGGATFVVRSPEARLNIRGAPSTEAPVAGKLADGARVAVIGAEVAAEGRAWLPVRAEGVEGWVAAEFLEATS
jgi:hypothetical protein